MKKMLLVLALGLLFASNSATADNAELRFETVCLTNAAPTARYSYFSSYGVVCYDHNGKELWQRNLPPAKNHYGCATAPILHDGHLILLLDADDGSSQLLDEAGVAENGNLRR